MGDEIDDTESGRSGPDDAPLPGLDDPDDPNGSVQSADVLESEVERAERAIRRPHRSEGDPDELLREAQADVDEVFGELDEMKEATEAAERAAAIERSRAAAAKKKASARPVPGHAPPPRSPRPRPRKKAATPVPVTGDSAGGDERPDSSQLRFGTRARVATAGLLVVAAGAGAGAIALSGGDSTPVDDTTNSSDAVSSGSSPGNAASGSDNEADNAEATAEPSSDATGVAASASDATSGDVDTDADTAGADATEITAGSTFVQVLTTELSGGAGSATLYIVLPVFGEGPLPGLFGVTGVDDLSAAGIEVSQGATTTGCGQGTDGPALVTDASSGWCEGEFSPFDAAQLSVIVADETLTGPYDPSVQSLASATFTFDRAQDDWRVTSSDFADLVLPPLNDDAARFLASVFGGDTGEASVDNTASGGVFDLRIDTVEARVLDSGVIEIVVQLNGAFVHDIDTAAIMQLGVQVDDGVGGTIFATYGFAGELGESVGSQDFRDLEALPALEEATVDVSADRTRVTFLRRQSDFVVGADGQVSANISIVESLDPDAPFAFDSTAPVSFE